MKMPRWFLFATSVLALNVILVIASGTRAHYFSNVETADSTEEEGNVQDTEDVQQTAEKKTPAESPSNVSLPATVTPSNEQQTLPGVPSLESPLPNMQPLTASSDGDASRPSASELEALSSDPVFQEIRRMFSEEGGEVAAPPLADIQSETTDIEEIDRGEAYFERLASRIETASNLTRSAHALIVEAAYAARHGDRQTSQQLLKMATTLREMAADLLVRPLL